MQLFLCQVLILVLMEDTLREWFDLPLNFLNGLNPCFNGRYSQSDIESGVLEYGSVLILVLMEDTLRESSGRRSKKPIKS